MICVALQENDVSKCLQILQTVELAEIRIDLAKFSKTDVTKIFSKSPAKLIATCRPDNYSDTERMILLKAAILAGAAYVDIEIESTVDFASEMVSFAKKNHTLVIVSYHNYKKTPNISNLSSIIKSCFNIGADIAKIATMVNSMNDVSKLLSLYNTNRKVIILGMGEKGKITRVLAPSFGSPFTFATLDESSATAPGQMTVEQLITIQNHLSKL